MSIFQGRSFKDHCIISLFNQAFVTHDDLLYVNGYHLYGLIGPLHFSSIYVPIVMINGSDINQGIEELSCRGSSILIKLDNDDVLGYGQNYYGELGLGSTSIIYTPMLIQSNVHLLSNVNQHSSLNIMMKKYNQNKLIGAGRNYRYFFSNNSYIGDIEILNFIKINATIIEDHLNHGNIIKFFSTSPHSRHVIFHKNLTNNITYERVYCWGLNERMCFISDSDDYVKYAQISFDMYNDLSDIQKGDDILKLKCSPYGCLMLIYSYEEERNKFLTWGTPDPVDLGRTPGNDWLPQEISQDGDWHQNDTIIDFSISNEREYMFVTKKGLLYGFGDNIALFSEYNNGAFILEARRINLNITFNVQYNISHISLGVKIYSFFVNARNCYGKSIINEDQCNGHGDCIEFNECQCRLNYTGNECTIPYTCNGYYKNDPQVCSGIERGECVNPNECNCIEGYIGNACEFYMCDISSEEIDDVCSGNGKCVASFDCICDYQNDYYGIYCGEYISEARFTSEMDEIHIEYEVDVALIPSVFRDFFNCSSIIERSQQKNCYFIMEADLTNFLVIPNAEKYKIGEALLIRPLTDPESYVILTIEDAIRLTFIEQYWYVFVVVSIVLIIICLIIIGFVAFTSFCVVIVKQRKSLEKFGTIDDIDILLEEKMAEEKGSNNPRLKFKKDFLMINEKDIQLKELIGHGGYGSIFKAQWEGKEVACKVISKYNGTEDVEGIHEFEREVSLLVSLKHPHIVDFYGLMISKANKLAYVMQLCKSDLRSFLNNFHKKNNKMYPYSEKMRLIGEIASGMTFLHSKQILHRDLKMENCLVGEKDDIKITDFGLSRFIESQNKTMTKGVGSSYYMSPQMSLGLKYTNKTDVFSFAIMIYEIFTGKKAFKEQVDDFIGIELKIAKNRFFRPLIEKEKTIPQFLISMAMKCWSHDERDRYSFEEIKEILENQKGDPVTIYLKEKGSNDEDAEDFLLVTQSLKGLEQIIKSKWPYVTQYQIFHTNKVINNEKKLHTLLKSKKDVIFEIEVQQNTNFEIKLFENLQKKLKEEIENLKIENENLKIENENLKKMKVTLTK